MPALLVSNDYRAMRENRKFSETNIFGMFSLLYRYFHRNPTVEVERYEGCKS